MGLAVLRVLAVMAVNGGFLFVLTLHVQGGLGYSALRAGLTFAPTAVVFGLVGLTWRRWPASWQRSLAPAGFTLTALSVLGVGLAFRGGDHGGAWLYAAYAGVGSGSPSPSVRRSPGRWRRCGPRTRRTPADCSPRSPSSGS